MAFVDKVSIEIIAGNGGPGAISFRKEKYVPKGGPDGGDGGKGGDIILKASDKLQTLLDFKLKKTIKAKNGSPGLKKNSSGKKGNSTTIMVPKGTMVFDQDKALIADLTKIDDEIIIAKGGKGGLGNQNFANAVNKTPRYAKDGKEGESKKITLELRLIAEVGLVGLPNAGKSTLLKVLTSANPKIGDYPFTTLYPNLGVLKQIDKEIILADIPGIIEGAAKGSGLGHDFLRHIDRTKILIHLIDVSSNDTDDIINNYHVFNNEIKAYHLNLSSKPQIVALSKIEMIDKLKREDLYKAFEKMGVPTIGISAHTRTGLEKLEKELLLQLQKIESKK